ncbi:MAG: response regulator transcription factor [Chryseolinea sp.]
MKRINILLVDDEALLREGVRSLLSQEPFIKSITEAGTASEFLSAISTPPDLILLDIRLKETNGLELLEMVRRKGLESKVIAVTGLEGVELMINLLKAGVDGIVFKLDGYQEIVKAIKGVLEKENYFPEKIVKIIQANAGRWDKVPPVLLNHQETELLKGIAHGLTTKEIAVQMKMGEATTETYRMRLIKKLGVTNTAALLAYAYRNGIL